MSLFKVFVLFLRLGALTFGGGIVMIGLLERELRGTEKLSSEETMEMIIFATALPGPIAANLAWLAGEKLAGKTGAFTAVLGTVIPPFLTILFLSKFFLLHMNDPLIAAFFLGGGMCCGCHNRRSCFRYDENFFFRRMEGYGGFCGSVCPSSCLPHVPFYCPGSGAFAAHCPW